MTRKMSHFFFGTLTAVLLEVSLAALVLMTIAASVGVQEAQAKKPPKDKKTNNGVSSVNSVAAWGDNLFGQPGNGTTDRHAPFQSRAVSGVVSVAAGDYHSLAG